MKRLKLFWRKPEKKIELDKGSILVAEHKGDVNYSRYVEFKQVAPQFWEMMDSPLFAVYLEKFEDAFNQSNWAKGHAVILDYKMAIDMSKSNHDAPKRLAMIASKGTLDWAYPPFILASAGAAMGWEVSIFFTFYKMTCRCKPLIPFRLV